MLLKEKERCWRLIRSDGKTGRETVAAIVNDATITLKEDLLGINGQPTFRIDPGGGNHNQYYEHQGVCSHVQTKVD